MPGYHVELEEKTLANTNYREVLFTSKNSQLVLMSLAPQVEIGMEIHADHDQFIRFEKGQGKVIMDGEEFMVKDGSAVVIPAGTEHNVLNTSDSEELKLYTVYTPPEHPDGLTQATKEDAAEYEANH